MKKKLIIISILFLIGINAPAKEPSVIKAIKTESLTVAKYKPSKRIRPDLKRIFLDVNFGDHIVINKGAVDSLKGMIITSISLIYTKYPR